MASLPPEGGMDAKGPEHRKGLKKMPVTEKIVTFKKKEAGLAKRV